MSPLVVILSSLAGTLIGGMISILPSLHIYNVAGISLLVWSMTSSMLPAAGIAPFFMSLIVSFSFFNTIPMSFLNAPDESAQVNILPSIKYMTFGRGYEGAMVQGFGSLLGCLLLAAMTPFFYFAMPYIHRVVSNHMHWILGLIMVYMVLSEWPKGFGRGKPLQQFFDAWQNVFAGMGAFALSGILGLIVLSKTVIRPEMAFQNVLPVFIGLFAIPSILQNLVSRHKIPKQHISDDMELTWKEVGKSCFQGSLAGLLAAYVPAVTAGIGGLLAGHATSQRGDRIFIMTGGVMKTIYYVGAFLLLFVLTPLTPMGMGRGGLAIILRPVFTPEPGMYFQMAAIVVFSGFISFLMMMKASKWALAVIARVDYHTMYWCAFALLIALVFVLTRWEGLLIMTCATFIGNLPVFFHARRSDCMAVLLVPIALNMAGYQDAVLRFFHLV